MNRPDKISRVKATAATFAATAAIAGAATAAIAGTAWAVRGRSSSVFAPSIWRGPRARPALALTFDDGPSESTPALLDLLDRHQVPATFFQCGANVERLPEIARAEREAGHEIGNHTYSHPMFCFRTPGFMLAEMERAQRAIIAHTGAEPSLFRAPYGVRWLGLRSAQEALGLTGVMWTVIGYDWNLAAKEIVRRISGGVSNGAIICLHDGRELQTKPDIRNTIRAAETLIPMLLDRGYRFETVSRLCQTT
jgi:peptidoglycan/xylan/chitin deacetylase (PgdA/CDA1 family)